MLASEVWTYDNANIDKEDYVHCTYVHVLHMRKESYILNVIV